MSTRSYLLAILYTVAIFTGAALLFVVQPMVGKLLLPMLGGSSSVWTTVMLFFQLGLLCGYIYAHGLAQQLPLRYQASLHGVLLVVSLLMLPLGVPEAIVRSVESPVAGLIGGLVFGIGLPVLVVSSTAPLLQHWFSALDHPQADDPYFLYSASNAGSVVALFSYPFVVERYTVMGTQQSAWTIGFVLLTILTGACALFVLSGDAERPEHLKTESAPDWGRCGWWVLYAAIPSSLMLGVTHYITMDMASVPLLWTVPLGVYLLTFIIAFARPGIPYKYGSLVLPALTIGIFLLTYSRLVPKPFLIIGHVGLFGLFALYFHLRLAYDRPDPASLTTYFIAIAFGGAIGGVFNSIVAPTLFDTLLEYPLVLALGLMLLPVQRKAYLYGALMIGGVGLLGYEAALFRVEPVLVGSAIGAALSIGVLLYYWPRSRSVVVALLFASVVYAETIDQGVVAKERSFFGQYMVQDVRQLDNFVMRNMTNGTTVHGYQLFRDKALDLPTGYYHPEGPLGDIFSVRPYDTVGIGGLGTGGIATYADDEDTFVFYEIDPAVERLARNNFTYLDECDGECPVVIGDARKKIEKTDRRFDMIIMDAYSSDAIPTHLLTKEAVQVYLSRLKDDGALVLHLSNRYLDLEGVAGAIADELDLKAAARSHYPDQAKMPFATASTYVVLSRSERYPRALKEKLGWGEAKAGSIVWTDSFTNIVSILK